MKPKYLHAAIVVLSLLVAGTQPALGTISIPSDTSIGTWDGENRIYTLTTHVHEDAWAAIQIDEDKLTLDGDGYTVTGSGSGRGINVEGRTGVTIKNVVVKGCYSGIYLSNSNYNTLKGNTTSNNTFGIQPDNSNYNTLEGNTALNNQVGISSSYSSHNTLTGNTTSNNDYGGIVMSHCSGNTITDNTAESNTYSGILLVYDCSDNKLDGNTALDNHTGIRLLYSCNNNTLICNTCELNTWGIIVNMSSSNNTVTGNTTSHNYGGIYLSNSSNDNEVADNKANSNDKHGIYIGPYCDNNSVTGNTVSNTATAIAVQYSSNNMVADNTASNNTHGIRIANNSSSNTLTGNTVSNNQHGIAISASNENKIYNNNFIANTTQASVSGSTGNIFNLSMSEGCGNYWSNHTGPDENGDGIVDAPYAFTGGQDHLPWVVEDGWLQPGWSPPGTDVTVQPVDETTGETLATLSFDNITEGGMTALTSMTPSENQGPPQGFRFGTPPIIINISTTATFTGQVEICFDYSGMSFVNESSLKLFHSSDGSNWVDITTSVDTENDTICGIVTSFSFFGVFETADPVVLLEELALQVTALNLQQGIDNSLDAKLEAALSALDDVNANDNVAAINSLEAFINAVEAQRGNKIPEADADDLIAAANEIIALLNEL